jgi:RepB DNA-primase from phage plasmid
MGWRSSMMLGSRIERTPMTIADARLFLEELTRGLPDHERAMVCYPSEATVQIDPVTGRKLNSGWFPEPWRPDKTIREFSNAYVVISSSIKTYNEAGQLRYWRGEASFGHGLALMVDDVGTGDGSKGALDLSHVTEILKPTAIVETSPDNFQLWYFLAAPVGDMALFKSFLVCFVNKVLIGRGGDATIRDVARYGRLPVGFNNKRNHDGSFKYGGKYGCPVTLFDSDYSRRYTMEEIAEAFDFKIKEPKRIPPPDSSDMNAIWYRLAKQVLAGLKMGEKTGGAVAENTSGKCRIQCPWGETHANGDWGGAYFRGYVLGAEHEYVFGCAHDTCRKAGRTWSVFVEYVVMPYVEEICAEADARLPDWSEVSRYKEA